MATKPVFEIAQEQGVSTQELLTWLRAAGVATEKSSFSLVDEDRARQLISAGRTSAPSPEPQGPLVWPEWMQRTPRRQRAQVPGRKPPRAQEGPSRAFDQPAPTDQSPPAAGGPQAFVDRPSRAPERPAQTPDSPRPAPPRRPSHARERASEPQPRDRPRQAPQRSPASPPRGGPPAQPARPGPTDYWPESARPTQPARRTRPAPRADTAYEGARVDPALAPTGSSFERRRRLRQLRRARDAELAKPRGQLIARRRDGEIRALEASLGRGGADAMGGTCPNCGLHSRRARHCQACGHALPGARMAAVRSMSIPAVIAAVVLIAGAFLLGGIRTGREKTRRVDAAPVAVPAYKNVVATARRRNVPIYLGQGDPSPLQTLSSPNADGAPLVFRVKQHVGSWLEVDLPTRPNGSTGWIRASNVTLTGHDYRMEIDLGSHRLTVWNGPRQVARVSVGVGQAVTPTPSGRYYITELLKQPEAGGIYGPWAFGLSAHSDVLDEFAGADGILGIHGTDYPRGIGTDVSHGCIRMSNAHITRLAHKVPVGTPVDITRV